MQEKPVSALEYLEALPEDRRAALSSLRDAILSVLPPGYVETVRYGIICYEVPLSTFKDTYNRQPLMYAGLASQKGHMAVHLIGIYSSEEMRAELEKGFRDNGKKLDAGKGCIRFKKLDDLPLDVILKTVAALSVEQFVALYKQIRANTKGSSC